VIALITKALLLATAVAPIAFAGNPPTLPPQPSAISAHHSSGQTFLTWTEADPLEVDRYRVYRYDAPIDATNLPDAQPIATVWPGSGTFYADRYYKPAVLAWEPRYFTRYVITDGGPQLAAGKGLWVWTLALEDFRGGSSGNGYYAVTSVDASGVENTLDFFADNTLGPIAESIDDPLPVLGAVLLEGRLEVYTQFIDQRTFNATLSSPNSYNDWYGLDETQPAIANALNYGFVYHIFPPRDDCVTGGEIEGLHPVVVNLHGFGGERFRPYNFDPAPTWCNAFRIYPIDISNTWWYGHARAHDYRQDLVVPSTDTIENYTEARVLRMIHDLMRHPSHGAEVDADRVYVYGHSMGASGTLALALRYPNVFAAAHASQPMTNYTTVGDGGGTDWRPDVIVKLGTPELDLPIETRAPAGWADALVAYDSTPAWDWQDHQEQVVERRGDEIVPVGIDHGLQDVIIEYSTQGEPAYAPFDASARCWSGLVQNALHVPSGIASMPGPFKKDFVGIPFNAFSARRAETVPGLSSASGAISPPQAPTSFNEAITWSASWNNWDGAPLDTATEWRLSLQTTDGMPATIDLCPRRLQAFQVLPDVPYVWLNENIATADTVASGVVFADADGLVTLPDFAVSPTGNRAIARPALRADTGTVSLTTGGAQQLDLFAGPAFAGKLYFVLGSATGTSPGLTLGSVNIPLVFDPYFGITLNAPNSPLLSPSLAVLGPKGEANCHFTLPPGISSSLAGLTLHHAFVVIDIPGDQSVTFASNAVSVILGS